MSKFPILWLTGQPGSGKTTLSNKIMNNITEDNNYKSINVIQVDGDDLRGLTENQDYSKEGRFKNIKLGQKIALFCQNKGYLVIVSIVAPYLELREQFKSMTDVSEFYLHTDEVRGREHYFSKDYVKPLANFHSIDTTNKKIKETAHEILSLYW
jgi:adenylylsulfate kinase-like enzyme